MKHVWNRIDVKRKGTPAATPTSASLNKAVDEWIAAGNSITTLPTTQSYVIEWKNDLMARAAGGRRARLFN